MSYYAFYAFSTVQSMHISGYLFPNLYLSWHNLLISNVVNGKTIQQSRCICLSHKQTNMLHTALMPTTAKNIKPLFYYNLTDITGPLVMQTRVVTNDSADSTTEPSVPICIQHTDTELKCL